MGSRFGSRLPDSKRPAVLTRHGLVVAVLGDKTAWGAATSKVEIELAASYNQGVPVSLNDRFFPLLLMSFYEPYAPGELDRHYTRLAAIADEAIRRQLRLVVILTSDPSLVSTVGRKQSADSLRRCMSPKQVDVTAASFVTVDSPLVRGVLTAFRWLSPDTLKTLRVTATMQQALDQALVALDQLGTPLQGDLAALRKELGLPT
jgi:hypothetical protein